MADYQFVLYSCGPGSQEIADLSTATNRALTLNLLDSGSASFDLNGLDPLAAEVRELATDLVIFRNGVKLFRGRIGPSQDTVDAAKHTVSFTAWDYRELLNRRVMLPGDTLEFDGVEQEAIGWSMISTVQSRPNGNMGITRGIGQSTGVSRTQVLQAGQKVGEQITTLSLMDSGFDWEIDPDLVYRTYYPTRGNPTGQYLLDLGGSVVAAQRTVDPSQYANVVRLTGGTPTLPDPPTVWAWSANASGFFTHGDRYRYAVSAITPEGETSPSAEVDTTVNTGDNAVSMTWTPVARATGYNIYGRNRNEGVSGLTLIAVDNAGSNLNPGLTYQYAVSAVTPDGETKVGDTQRVQTGGSAHYYINLTWNDYPRATAYRIYGRNDSDTLELIGQVTTTNYQDYGFAVPNGPLPQGYPMHRIAGNIQTTSWTDNGVSVPTADLPAGKPSILAALVSADDAVAAPEGIWESQIGNQDLLYTEVVDARAGGYLRDLGILRPTYALTLASDHWAGPQELWLGDIPMVSINSGRLSVEEATLRVTQLSFKIDDSGHEAITVTLGYRALSPFDKVIRTQSRLDMLERR